jgi:DNA-binding transcriptional regulator YhcF (GntR family)
MKNIQTSTYIAPEIILNADNQRAMIFYFFVKSKYRHSIIYKYSPNRLALLTGIAPNTIRKYVGWLKGQGYIKIDHGNLHFRAVRKIAEGEKLLHIDSRPWTTWRQFENRVYAGLIKRNLLQQDYHYTMRGGTYGKSKKVNLSVTAHRRYLRKYETKGSEESVLPPRSSVRQLARYFGKSTYWVSTKLKLLERMGYISTKKLMVSVPQICPPDWVEGVYAYHHRGRGTMILHYGTVIRVKH